MSHITARTDIIDILGSTTCGADGIVGITVFTAVFICVVAWGKTEKKLFEIGSDVGTMLKILSNEIGQTSLIPTSAHSRNRIFFGAFFSTSLKIIAANIIQHAVMLISSIFMNKASIVWSFLLHRVYQSLYFRDLILRE